MRINRNTRRSARPVFRSVNSSRRRVVNNNRTLNSGRNYGTYCTFRIIDFPSFNIDTDRNAAIDYLNTHTFADIPVKVDDIYEDHNTYRVHLTYDMDEETGFNAWVGKQNAESPIMDIDETSIYSLIYSVLSNWDRIDTRKMNSSRRRAMNRRRMLNSGRQRLNSAVAGDVVTFNELNEAQKQSAIEGIWNTRGAEWVYETFNEMAMEVYKDDIKQLAAECEASIDAILGEDKEAYWEINTDALYWDSSSQGPYPDWHLNEVFGGLTIKYINPAHIVSNYSPSQDGKPAVESVDLVWDYYSKAQDANDFTINIEYFDPVEGDWYGDYGIDPADPAYGIPAKIQEKIKNIVNVLQHFLDTAWSYIQEVYNEVPDDAYAYDLYEANDWGDFEVIDDQTATYYNDDWDDEIAGVDYY